jgi:hypothetical protein
MAKMNADYRAKIDAARREEAARRLAAKYAAMIKRLKEETLHD